MTAHHAAAGDTTSDAVPTPQLIPTREAVLVVGAVSAYAKAAKDHDATARTILGTDYLSEGDRVTIRDPRDGTKLGTVSMSDPTPVAEVDDEAALVAHIATSDPDGVFTPGRDIAPDRYDEAIDVLAEHAPHLLTDPPPALRPWAREAALKAAVGGELSPGITVRTRRGVVSVRPAEGATERYRELVAGGHVDPLREIPAAPAQ